VTANTLTMLEEEFAMTLIATAMHNKLVNTGSDGSEVNTGGTVASGYNTVAELAKSIGRYLTAQPNDYKPSHLIQSLKTRNGNVNGTSATPASVSGYNSSSGTLAGRGGVGDQLGLRSPATASGQLETPIMNFQSVTNTDICVQISLVQVYVQLAAIHTQV